MSGLEALGTLGTLSDIYDVAQAFLAALEAMDSNALGIIATAWDRIGQQATDDLHALFQEAEAWKDANPGKALPPNFAYKGDRLNQVLRNAQYQLEAATTPEVLGQIEWLQAQAIAQAQADAVSLVGSAIGDLSSNFHTVRADVVNAMVGLTADGSPLAALFAGYGDELGKAITDAWVVGTANGWGPERMARMLRGKVSGMGTRAMTIARTESMRLYRHVSHATYLANADVLTGWTWHARADARCCRTCWAMHGTLHHLEERLDGHPNCRCIMVPYTFTWKSLGAKGPKGGDITGDPGETRLNSPLGSDLFADLDPKVQRRILGPGMHDLYAEGKVTLPDMVGRTYHGKWGTMRSQASIDDAKWYAHQRVAAPKGTGTDSQAWRLGGQHVSPIKAKPGDGIPTLVDIEPDLGADLAVKAQQIADSADPIPPTTSVAPEAPVAPRVDVTGEKFPHDPGSLVEAPTGERLTGGAHAKTTYQADDGSLWLFKPVQPGEEFLAELDVATSILQKRSGLAAPDTYIVDIGGKTGSIQRVFGTADTRRAKFRQGPFDPTKLSAQDTLDLQTHHAFDWMVSNHDGHADQFIRLSGSMDPIAIDKGQSYKFFGKDRIDPDYSPNSNVGVDSVYNVMHRAQSKGDLDYFVDMGDLPRTHTGAPDTFAMEPEQVEFYNRMKAMQDIPDDEFRAILRPYAVGAHRRGVLAGGDVEAFLDAAVARKNGLVDDVRGLHKRLAANRPVPDLAPDGLKGMAGAKGMTGPTVSRYWDEAWAKSLTQEQRNAITSYTGSSYHDLNSRMRSGRTPGSMADHLHKATGSKPMPRDAILWRGTGSDTWGGISPKDMVGRVAQDRGFMSTSYGNTAAFSGKDVLLRIRVPKGHPAVAATRQSSYGAAEREILLQDGCTYYVHSAKRVGHQWHLDVEVLPPGAPPPPNITQEIVR
jgi:SPP1 gp7 family putative phage head morphogenesis protein